MRSFILGAAALLAVAAPSLAFADTGGHVELVYASIDADDSFFEADNTVALSGAVVTDLNDRWRLQFNAVNTDTEVDDFGDSESEAISQGEVHATYAADKFDVGVFAGLFNHSGESFYEYGAEAAYNFERGEVGLSVAGATSPNADSAEDITSVAATGSFRLTDNLSIGAGVSSTNFGDDGDGDIEATSYGVSIAFHIPDSNFVIGAGFRTSNVEDDDSDEDVDFFGVSLAWGFGQGAAGRTMQGASALVPDSIAAISF